MKLLLFLILIIALPVILGTGLSREKDRLLLVWVKGYLLELALVFLPAFICALKHTSLRTFTGIYLACLAAFAVWALVRKFSVLKVIIKNEADAIRDLKTTIIKDKAAALFGGAALILILLQAVIPVAAIHIDDDDATYVAMTTVAVDTGSVLDYDPLTGNDLREMTGSEIRELGLGRYIISPLYAYDAVLSRLSAIRPAVLCHTVLPFFLTLMAYILYAEIGKRLFHRKAVYTGLFLIVLSLVFMSSYSSVYTSGTFLLVRIWQGKGQMAGIAAPALYLAFLDIVRESRAAKENIIFLQAVLVAAVVMTALGGVLGVVAVSAAAAALLLLRVIKNGRTFLAVEGTCLLPLLIMAYYAVFLS